MIRRAGPALRVLLAVALLYGSGAHWLLVQGAAWAGMLAARSGRASVSQAVTTTFDGAHPCRVCRLVERGAASGSAPRAVVSSSAVDFAFLGALSVTPELVAFGFETSPAPAYASRAPAPLSPPPDVLRAA